ncbi:MAG: DNA cytosine methyltransferase [Prevotella sp.]|nr:DNA cytosine methyltransferase [Prevotella sp.]
MSANSWEQNNLLITPNYIQYDRSGKGYRSQTDRAYYETCKHGTLGASSAESKTGVIYNDRIRRLTPTECARLQTIPDWYKWECSDSQIYRMCGNGWTIEVIKHILSYLNE